MNIHRNVSTAKLTGAAAWIAAMASISPGTVGAAEWLTEASVDIASFHDDNVLLVAAPAESTSGYILAPRFNIKRNTEISKAALSGYLAHTSYTQGSIADQNEGAMYLKSEKQLSELSAVGLDAEARRDTLFERVDRGPGVGNLRDTDIGLSDSAEVRRTYQTFQPYFTRMLTERSDMRVSYRLTDASFSQPSATGLVDYKEHLLSASYNRQFSDRDSFNVTSNVARYRPQSGNAESETLQLLAGVTRKFAEATRGSFAIGVSETTQTDAGQNERASGVVFRASMEQKSELSTFDGVISRDVTPSGIGRSLQTDQLRVHWVRKTSPTVDFALQAQLFRNNVLEGSAPDIDRRYYELQPELRWHWLENWIVSGSYRYRKQKFDVDAGAADSNAIFLGLTYTL